MKSVALQGSLLALVTAVSWGVLPLAMKQVVTTMTPQTIVWYRFGSAFLWLFFLSWRGGSLPKIPLNRYSVWIPIIVGSIALTGNFVLYNTAVSYLPAPVIQVIIQLSSVILLLVSIPLFKEPFLRHHKIGVVALLVGLALFFNERLAEIFTSLTEYTTGVIIGVCAALSWVVYGIIQKVLSKRLKSSQILLLLYLFCFLFITPFAKPMSILELDKLQLYMLLFCCLNTIIAYGAFAEAMLRWNVSNVNAIVTLAPLFTILSTDLFHWLYPDIIEGATLNIIAYIGAFIVVVGAISCASGDKLFKLKKVDTLKQEEEYLK